MSAAAVAHFISNERAALCAVLRSSLKGKREVSRLNEKCDYKVAAAQNSHSPPQIERLDKLNYHGRTPPQSEMTTSKTGETTHINPHIFLDCWRRVRGQKCFSLIREGRFCPIRNELL